MPICTCFGYEVFLTTPTTSTYSIQYTDCSGVPTTIVVDPVVTPIVHIWANSTLPLVFAPPGINYVVTSVFKHKLTACNNLTNIINTSTNLGAYVGQTVKITGSELCWQVAAARECLTNTPVAISSVYTDCIECADPTSYVVLDFISCCGARLYFQIPSSSLPLYGNVNDTYVYNGPPIADSDGTIMYPGQCYYISAKGGSFTPPRINAPLPIYFGPLLGINPESCNLDQCQHCFYKLSNCNDSEDFIISYSNLSIYLGQVITIADSAACWIVTETDLSSPTPIPVYPSQSYASCEKCNEKSVMFTSCCGFTAYFKLSSTAPYLSEGNVYIYNGSPIADGFGNTLYPNICYAYSEFTTLTGTVNTPALVNFSTSLGLTCESSQCQSCFYLLTDCNDPSNTITTYTNLSAAIGQTISIQGSDKCWTVTETTVINNPVSVILNTSYDSCPCCKGYYFTLNDCCTDEPYVVNSAIINGVVILKYNCVSSPGLAPSDLASVIITNVNDITGCFKLTEIDITKVTTTPIIIPWQVATASINTVPTCEDCINCPPFCYLLTSCIDPDVTLVTGTDLSDYLGGVITIKNCKDTCWIVSEAENCDDCGGEVEIISYYPPLDSDQKICTYSFKPTDSSAVSVDITVDNVTYNVPFGPNIIDDLNALSIGEFTNGGGGGGTVILNVAGSANYQQICINYLTLPQTCELPTCVFYTKSCIYEALQLGDGNLLPSTNVTITINGVVLSTVLTGFGVNKLINWLNSLNQGVFGYTIVGSELIIVVYGNSTYGPITLGDGTEQDVLNVENCITISQPNCDACLPQPEPEPPLVLNTRFVKPGYTTPFCPPEYTEKVNCNYGDQLYNRMLSARYGLTVCCDESFDKWLIKKELLDLDSIRNTEFVCCPPIAPCNVCNTQECCCVVIPVEPCSLICYSAQLFCNNRINCTLVYADCSGTFEYLTLIPGESLNTYICSSILPTFSSNNIITPLLLDCATGACVAPSSCFCWSITPDFESGPIFITYDTCNGVPVTIDNVTLTVEMCSPVAPVVVGNYVTVPPILCNTDCGITDTPTCQCYIIKVTSSDASIANVDFNVDSCNLPPTQINVTSLSGPVYGCYSFCPSVATSTSNAVVTITIRSDLDCELGQCALPV